MLSATASAKLNLCLHVSARTESGYHPLESLVAFTEFGDTVSVKAATEFSMMQDGEFAKFTGDPSDNIVMRAARLLAREAGISQAAAIHVTKNIPVGAGLGGGSSDAAVALTLLRALWGVAISDNRMMELAAELGSDVPMCLAARPCIARGRGEILYPLPEALPPYYVVLVYPRRVLSTADVFAAYAPAQSRGALPDNLKPSAILDVLSDLHNDLQRAAISLCPEIAEVLLVLDTAVQQPELVRMSGSGSCCFALFSEESRADSLVRALQKSHPGWWVAFSKLRCS